MTYQITALSNDRAQLIIDKVSTTDQAVAEFAEQHWIQLGHKVIKNIEE